MDDPRSESLHRSKLHMSTHANQLHRASPVRHTDCARRDDCRFKHVIAQRPRHLKQCSLQVMAGTRDLQTRKDTLNKMYLDSKKTFPKVSSITCPELHRMLQTNSSDVVLVDVRSPAEQELSVLPGSVIRKEDFDKQKQQYRNNTIVTYCTIGVRSGRYAQELMDQGLPHVYNLQGSIIAWTQEGLPLWKGDGSKEPTNRVHTFGKTWDLAGPGFETVTYGAVQGGVEIVRSVLPPILGGR